MSRRQAKATWTSRWAFILAATGSAVGLGNVWKFPYITGEHGGGAFVLVYLLCIALIGIPVMLAEVTIGRRARANVIDAYALLAREQGGSGAWRWAGWLGVTAGFLVLSFYAVIAGWAGAYVFETASGRFAGSDPEAISAAFAALKSDPFRVVFWDSVILLATFAVVARGVHKGIERSVTLLMPLMFAILLVIVLYAALNGDFAQGARFLFSADFSRLTANGVLVALGHAFFTLSLGAGIMVIYGAYLPQEASIPRATLAVAFADTLVALLAGMAIFPIVFAHGLEPGAGPGLIFQSFPIAFGDMPGGTVIGTLFFVMLVVAAFASTISLAEVLVAYLEEHKGWTRARGATLFGFAVWVVSLGTAFSFNIGAEMTVFGLNFFQAVDYLATNILLPLGGVAITVFAAWILHREYAAEELGWHTGQVRFQIWQWVTRVVTPALILVVFANAIGLIRF